ncbi:MAG: hypothetical protein KIT45_07535 [Fimbriimonadia bacterium]|nr:hypothetical protein [Fimbriimonadia bacterium]
MTMNWRRLACAAAVTMVMGAGFAQQAQPEMRLLGLRLFSPVVSVLKAFGNPTEITPQTVAIGGAGGGMPGGAPGLGGAPMGGPMGGPMGAPGGLGGPMGGDMGGGGGLGGGSGTTSIETETLYRYQVKGGYNYLFLANKDGRIIQMMAYGLKPNPRVRTTKGITLGDSYKKVVTAYGYPTEHEYQGNVYAIRYNRRNVAFILDSKKHTVIAVIVAAGIPRTGMGFSGGGGGAGGGMPGAGGGPGGGAMGSPGELPPPPGMGAGPRL